MGRAHEHGIGPSACGPGCRCLNCENLLTSGYVLWSSDSDIAREVEIGSDTGNESESESESEESDNYLITDTENAIDTENN